MINEIDCDPDTEGRPVVGFPKYLVTPDGFVWSKRHYSKNWMSAKWVKIKGLVDDGGYIRCRMLKSKNSTRKHITVHKIVLLAFVGPCPEGMECCHNDGNRKNNVLSNLRWDTKKNNQGDRLKHGTDNRGEKSGKAKLNNHTVIEIKKLLMTKITLKKIAEIYGVTSALICAIKKNRIWKHIKIEDENV